LVFKIVDTRLHTRTDAKTPKWAIAYKFPAEERQVELLDVVWQVGRTGMQTPVAVITPTYLGGVVIENITLHNPDFIKRNNITLPGLLTIIRSGDVIPKVVGAEPQGKPVEIPTECACCKTPLQWTETQKQIFCPNPSCETKLVLFWENFASRLAMNIIGLSVETIKELVAADYLTHRLDSIFMLYGFKESIKEWEGWSDVSTMNLVNAIEKAKTTDKQRVITALGIEGIGASNSKLIARTFKNLSELPDVTADQIAAIRGLGEVIADSWVQFWKIDSHRESYLEMLKLLNGVEDASGSGFIEARKIVI
jgi:DNA ligase (NAD+)